ncbi:MAG: phospho-N-acetylmuramoyl-pentapeptide-transferase [Lachnospiraceae bacterium]|nr:phospho-N-acetylmuramoyl-pentapeptide-transferase [Lachnospiraceae bacterium]
MRDTLLAIIISFAVSAVMGPLLIPLLLRLKVGQTVRKEGPESHLAKNGTPTIGGLIFLAGIAVVSVVFGKKYPKMTPVMILIVAFGLIGFIDDFIKVVLKRSKGLAAWQKFSLQFIVTALFAWFLVKYENIDLDMIVPFIKREVDPGYLGLPVLFLAVLGTDTGSNFTDGLDGLAASVTAAIAMFFIVAAAVVGGEGASAVSVVSAAVFGGLLGFLLFNANKAKVFMGDTGALALGGFVAGAAYMLHLPLLLPVVAVIYVIEVASVMIQVSYFKLTHGKRIFKMSPIHHHFEKCGWSEAQIMTRFTVVTIIASAIGLLSII